ncbi:hypothetical protein PHYPSEUDO_012202 [Phytophthora pseudosyringae]|uniref:Uncharacterized protein n=1 Tax=Phytophthora pseudosyringae TaxID=221518 RepID=A0A8T1W5A0_9STRA|nr:hypothetical protein PHYPSEUDO_012202 [Phytophthora pseudosyringae]
MEVTKLRDDLTQCWLAEALVQVLERAATQCQVDRRIVLVSLGGAAVAEQGTELAELVKGFLRRGGGVLSGTGACYAHVGNVDELLQWTRARVASGEATGVVFVVYAPCEDGVAAKQVEEEVASKLQSSVERGLLLVLHNPAGLLGLAADTRAMESSAMYSLQHFGALGTESDSQRHLQLIAQPLDWLRDQCGWRFVMEIVRWVPESKGAVTNGDEVFGAARATMFSSINQLPFQLLLLVLRWSHFHPELVRACAKKLRRQTQLLPQARVRREIAELHRLETDIWSGLYPSADVPEQTLTVQSKQEVKTSPLFLATSCSSVSPKLARLSECCLWDTQKQFYKDQGIRAWSSGAIPFGVSSSSFLAAAYARIAVDFLLSTADWVQPSFRENGSPNCFVWEAASGSCKFLHSFMLHFTELVEANDEFKRWGLVPLVVATDLSEQVLSSRRRMACFRTFIERGQLDFALFDTHEFVHGNPSVSGKRKALELVHSQRSWHVGSDGPVALMGNYFLDSLRADIFTVAVKRDPSPVPNLNEANAGEDSSNEHVVIQTALLDKDTSSITDMDIRVRLVADPRTQAVYEDDRLNATLVQVLDQFRSLGRSSVSAATGPISSTGLVIFPVEAFEFFLTLIDQEDNTETFPVAILAGDAHFSFRDAISSAFITTTKVESHNGEGSADQVRLELPQLSPHPDCFCLPVDFEVFELFFRHLNSSNAGVSASAELVTAPASDTFDVFFATIEPQRPKKCAAVRDKAKTTPTAITKALHTSFRHEFARFTPGDCDLLWGMMSFDDGARCFSADALLALLAQTGWDFDLFAVFRWELLNRLRRQEVNTESEHYQRILIEAGVKSWRMFYHMEQQTEMDATTREIRLQLARWFYELEAYDTVLEVLMTWRDEVHNDVSSDDVGVFYLLGVMLRDLRAA